MPTTISPLHRFGARATGLLVALSLAAPVAHAAPGAPRRPGMSKRALAKQAEAEARAAELRAEELRAALAEAQAVREREMAAIQPLLASGLHERAASRLLAAALAHEDPVLHIEAAEQFLAAADRTRPEAIDRGRASLAAAGGLLAAVVDPLADTSVDLRTVRVAQEDVEGLRERADATQRRLDARGGALREQRRGRQELAAGASLLAVGLTGAAVLAGGVAYRVARSRELAAIAGHEAEYDLSDLDAQGRRSDAMIGAGAAIGIIGVALGASLLALGARDLRAESRPRRARLRVAPTLGGLVLSGRF